MSRKRQRKSLKEDPDPALRDYNALDVAVKRPRYDLRTGQVRECCSLPQYDKQPCQHKYHLRPFDHRKPNNNHAISKESVRKLAATRAKGGVCTKLKSEIVKEDLKRNAHSYSINGHVSRCSDSSTASGRQRVLQALKKGTSKGGSHQLKEEVSLKAFVVCGFLNGAQLPVQLICMCLRFYVAHTY